MYEYPRPAVAESGAKSLREHRQCAHVAILIGYHDLVLITSSGTIAMAVNLRLRPIAPIHALMRSLPRSGPFVGMQAFDWTNHHRGVSRGGILGGAAVWLDVFHDHRFHACTYRRA